MSDADPEFYLQYNNIRVLKPEIADSFQTKSVTPFECRVANLTYAANIEVDLEYFYDGNLIRLNGITIGKMPIMLGS